MLTGLNRLGLEVKDLDSARTFYEDRLGLVADAESTVTYRVGPATPDTDPGAVRPGATALVLRRPTDTPRGGVHTHYAFSTTPSAYEQWRQRLADLDPVEFSFGSADSLYVYDPAGNCVEIGSFDQGSQESEPTGATDSGPSDSTDAIDSTGAPPLSDLFEVVLEVTDLPSAEARYRRLGFEVVDRGEKRRRVRLTGPVDLELWEPQLGIADARGGLHVDLAFVTPDPDAAIEAGEPWPTEPTSVPGGRRVVDDDGHVLTFLEPTEPVD